MIKLFINMNTCTLIRVQTEPDSEPEGDQIAPPEQESCKLTKVQEVDESLVSRYCVVKHDGQAYPGIILSVDEELEVKFIHRVGRNRLFWPGLDDTLWYEKQDILVTSRYMQVDPTVCNEVEKEKDWILFTGKSASMNFQIGIYNEYKLILFIKLCYFLLPNVSKKV